MYYIKIIKLIVGEKRKKYEKIREKKYLGIGKREYEGKSNVRF